MAGMMKKGLSWLGLGPDADYDGFDDYAHEEPVVDLTASSYNSSPSVRAVNSRAVMEAEDWDEDGSSAVRVVSQAPAQTTPKVRALPGQPTPEPIRPRGGVRPLSTHSAKPHLVAPESFNDAQEVGDWFKKAQPVILNLQGIDRDLVRRMLDFASGVAYALGGTVERVATQVYLLTPADVEVSAEDKRRVLDRAIVRD